MTPRILLALVTRATRRLQIRDFTNGRESDLDGPIRHAKRTGICIHRRCRIHRRRKDRILMNYYWRRRSGHRAYTTLWG